MTDPLETETHGEEKPRQRFTLDETGFDEVPPQYRRFYRKWGGPPDKLSANEALCPVCKVVIRSMQELREGDRLYCMPCMSRLVVVREDGMLLAKVVY
jgi:hypothetical protein